MYGCIDDAVIRHACEQVVVSRRAGIAQREHGDAHVVLLRQEVEFFDGEIGMGSDEELHAALGEFVEHLEERYDGLGVQGGLDLVEEDDGARCEVAIGQELVEYRDFLDAFGCCVDGVARVAFLVVPLVLLLVVVDGAAQDVSEESAAGGEVLVVVAALAGQLQGLDEVEVGVVEAVHHVLLARFEDDVLQGEDFFGGDVDGVAVAVPLKCRPGLQDLSDGVPPEFIGDGFVVVHCHGEGQFGMIRFVDQVAQPVGLKGPVQFLLQDVRQGLLRVAALVLLQGAHGNVHGLEDEGLPCPVHA